jgi:hypothetical protein
MTKKNAYRATPTTEVRAGKIIRRAKLQDIVIKSLYGATALTLAVMAPKTLGLLRGVDPDLSKKRKPDYRIRQALSRLEKKGLVARTGHTFALTGKGERYGERLRTLEAPLTRPRRWDGRWRIVIFDIWERRRLYRTRLRHILKKIGFIQLQHSVWVYPYDCEELVVFIRTELKLGPSVLYIVAEGIEGDARLRRRFSLPKAP